VQKTPNGSGVMMEMRRINERLQQKRISAGELPELEIGLTIGGTLETRNRDERVFSSLKQDTE